MLCQESELNVMAQRYLNLMKSLKHHGNSTDRRHYYYVCSNGIQVEIMALDVRLRVFVVNGEHFQIDADAILHIRSYINDNTLRYYHLIPENELYMEFMEFIDDYQLEGSDPE